MPRFLLALIALPLLAQDLENFRIELTGSAWIHDTTGTVQSGIVPIDLKTDLGIEQNVPQFYGKLTLKPSQRNRIFVECTPYSLTGSNTLNRTVVFAGRTYNVRDVVTSSADMTYVGGGYQFDVLSRGRGHLGLQAEAAYVNATGTIHSQTLGITGTEQQSFAMPLVGIEGRVFLIPLVNINAELKGMDLGDFGHYVQGTANIGLSLGRHVTVQGGYMVVDTDVHRKDQTRGITPRFNGPVVGIQIRG